MVILPCLRLPSQLQTQEYTVSYKGKSIEQVISDLRKKTGYEFVYQKQILDHIAPITCTYRKVTLNQILDRIFYNDAELDYEIVGKTIVLSVPKEEQPHFKQLITGMVTDQEGEPLLGVSVRQIGTNSGTVTDLDGQFSLIIEGKSPVLNLSYVGMKKEEVRINRGGHNFLVIQLQEDDNLMNEVLVTGYQNLKR